MKTKTPTPGKIARAVKALSFAALTLILHRFSGEDIGLIQNYLKSYTVKFHRPITSAPQAVVYSGKDYNLCTPTPTGQFQQFRLKTESLPRLAQWLHLPYTIV